MRIKKLPIYAGVNIAVLNPVDADSNGISASDRILISNENKQKVAIADIDVDGAVVKHGEIGVFKDISVFEDGEEVNVKPLAIPESVKYIRKKISGLELGREEIRKIMSDINEGKLLQIEIASYLTAVKAYGMSTDEIVSLTEAMVEAGRSITWPGSWVIADKHSIGGIPNNRTTPIFVSIISLFGLKVPKTSSRAITSPAGTADVIEVFSPVSFSVEEIIEIVRKAGACLVWGGALDISPVDDKLIRIENALSIDPEAQVIASVLSKKKAIGSKNLLIDIPYGENAKVKEFNAAKNLAMRFKTVASKLGMRSIEVISDGSQPIGNGIGPCLEAMDIVKVLKNEKEPADLREKCIELSGKFLEFMNLGSYGSAEEALRKGKAFEKFREIIEAQGGRVEKDISSMLGKYSYDVKASESGLIEKVVNTRISTVARLLGAPVFKGSGLYLYKKAGEKVRKGEKLFRLYAESEAKLSIALEYIKENPPYIIRGEHSKFIKFEL